MNQMVLVGRNGFVPWIDLRRVFEERGCVEGALGAPNAPPKHAGIAAALRCVAAFIPIGNALSLNPPLGGEGQAPANRLAAGRGW